MTFTDFINATGEVLEKSFTILPMFGDLFNNAVIVIGFVGLFYWLGFQMKKTKQAKRDGTYI